jgi:hypothetical protein
MLDSDGDWGNIPETVDAALKSTINQALFGDDKKTTVTIDKKEITIEWDPTTNSIRVVLGKDQELTDEVRLQIQKEFQKKVDK